MKIRRFPKYTSNVDLNTGFDSTKKGKVCTTKGIHWCRSHKHTIYCYTDYQYMDNSLVLITRVT